MTTWDPELEALLPTIPHLDASEPEAARARSIALGNNTRPTTLVPPDRVTVDDHRIPGPPDAPELHIRVYTPVTTEGKPLPCMVFYHGGGWISGTLENGDWRCLQIADECQCVVVTPAYRLAPEDPFPAAPEDCLATYLWTLAHVETLRLDLRAVGVGGVSAGGGLAAAVTLMARDRELPLPGFQWLLYPALDDRMDTASNLVYTDSPVWGADHSRWAWRFYLGDAGRDGTPVSPYAAPQREPDLKGLPPAYVMTCEGDPLRDEGLEYACRLLQAGVSVDVHNWSHVFHAFDFVGQSTEIGRRAVSEQLYWLRRAVWMLQQNKQLDARATADRPS